MANYYASIQLFADWSTDELEGDNYYWQTYS